jgi:primosomal protein N'
MLNSEHRQDLHQAIERIIPRLEQEKKTRWSIDVDPVDMQ